MIELEHSLADRLVKLNGGGEERFPPLPAPAAFSGEKDESVEHNSPSDDFLAFIESASESEDDESPVVASRPPVQRAGRVTRAGAARAGISVPEISLPARCWASSAFRKKENFVILSSCLTRQNHLFLWTLVHTVEFSFCL